MRPKFILIVALMTALVLGAAFFFKQRAAPLPPESPPDAGTLPSPAHGAVFVAASNSISRHVSAPVAASAPVPGADTMTLEQRQVYIEEETAHLQDLSTRNDPAALAAVLNDLTNSEKEIRLAAIEATKQLGNRDAIPALKADVGIATDTAEQMALLEAADFLSLPTIADSDVQRPKTPDQVQAAQQLRQRAALRKQAQMQRHPRSQNPPPDAGQDSEDGSNN